MKNVGDPPAGTSDHPVWDLFGVGLWHCLGGDLMRTGCYFFWGGLCHGYWGQSCGN